MTVHFTPTPDQEAKLKRAAARTGRNTAELVAEAVARYLDHEEWFSQAVEQGRASARRGELLEHDDVVARIEQRFRS